MNFETYLKSEIEKLLFIEINRDITLKLSGNPVLKCGEYPIFPRDMVNFANDGGDGISVPAMIDAMIYIIACDPSFKYNRNYMDFLNSIEGIESYIIMEIEKNKSKNLKRALIYTTALYNLKPGREYGINRVYLLMDMLKTLNQKFIEDEILKSLNRLIDDYPGYLLPHYYLGEYYLNRDIDAAKIHLRKCLEDPITFSEASKLLEKIKNIEDYDKTIELVKEGRGGEALKTLIPYVEENPENLDAKYYLAVALRQNESYHKALIILNELTESAERLEVYSEIGINLASLGEFEGALEYFTKALKIMPSDTGIICNMAVCHLNLGQIKEAKDAFSLVSRINPKDEIAAEWLERLKEV